MKKTSSAVWKFFERLIENDRCYAVVCKLCESQYKFFGNTTNLRVHLINKHPIQWELSENGTLDESTICVDTSIEQSTKKKYGSRRRSTVNKNVGYSVSIDNNEDAGETGVMPKIEIQRVDVLQNSDSDNDQDTLNMVRQMHGDQSGEEWLEEDPYQITHFETYEPKPKRRKMKYQNIKREVTSPTDLPNFYVAPKAKPIVYEDVPKKDEYSVFGEYIANKLRKLKAPRTRGNLQQLITTILWQAEYGLYDNADAVKRVLMMNLNEPQPSQSETVEFDSSSKIETQIIEQEVVDQSTESLGIINDN